MWCRAFPPTRTPPISDYLLLSVTRELSAANCSSENSFINMFIHEGENCLAQRICLLISWEIDLAGKFVTLSGGYRDYFFTLNLKCFQLHSFLLPYFSHSSNFPQEWWDGEEPLTGTSNCYQSVIRFSLFFLSTQACAQHCLQIRHLGDEWNLLPKSCDVLDFLRSEQLL